ncbi:hypothetical protein M885DRAFT_435686 [Pelagophyceae sp. CCMP2097]|nr:hypothetical protein M885DRAFT_435686 [Pelagophyceae sp. CCMP2097]
MKPHQGDKVWKSIRDELKDLETGEYTAKEPHHNLVRDVRADVQKFCPEKGVSKRSKPRQLVGDLACLFAQAARLQEAFQAAVAVVATKADVLVDHSNVKRRKRAIEKLFRNYDGDASRLTDLVRCSIKCKDAEALLRCLRAIKADDRFVVVFSKDRFRESYDVQESLSYRNIALSVCFVDTFSLTHNVEYHVCELQIGLKSFEDLRKEEGHTRYVKWRNDCAA